MSAVGQSREIRVNERSAGAAGEAFYGEREELRAWIRLIFVRRIRSSQKLGVLQGRE
jgi:hypothetical protein